MELMAHNRRSTASGGNTSAIWRAFFATSSCDNGWPGEARLTLTDRSAGE